MIDLVKLRELVKQKMAEEKPTIKVDVRQVLQNKYKSSLIQEDKNIYETEVHKVANLISPSLPKTNTLIFAKSDNDYVWVGNKDLNLSGLVDSKVHFSKVYNFR